MLPLNDLRVLRRLRETLGQDEAAVRAWIAHWIGEGFRARELQAPETGFPGGERPMLPDLVLVPQVCDARRWEVPLDAFPRLRAIAARCEALDAFARAAPEAGGRPGVSAGRPAGRGRSGRGAARPGRA